MVGAIVGVFSVSVACLFCFRYFARRLRKVRMEHALDEEERRFKRRLEYGDEADAAIDDDGDEEELELNVRTAHKNLSLSRARATYTPHTGP